MVCRSSRSTTRNRRSRSFPSPETEDSRPTQIAGKQLAVADLPPTARSVLVALARPYKHDEFATPATNQEIADELHLSVDAVKSRLRDAKKTLRDRLGDGTALPEDES